MKIDWIWLSFGINVHHLTYTHPNTFNVIVCVAVHCTSSHIFDNIYFLCESMPFFFVTVVYKCCFHQFHFDTILINSIDKRIHIESQMCSMLSYRTHETNTLYAHTHTHFGARSHTISHTHYEEIDPARVISKIAARCNFSCVIISL